MNGTRGRSNLPQQEPVLDSNGFIGRLIGHFRRSFVTGSLVLLPVAITYLVLKFLFDVVDGFLGPAIEWGLNQWIGGAERSWSIPGVGIVVTVLLLYFVGFTVANVVGERFIRMVQKGMLRVPLIGTIYSASAKLVESFSATKGATGFKRVVMLQYPREGYWSIGFLTSISLSNGKKYAMVYIPTAPLPNSGWVAFVPVEEVYDTNLTVNDAMQLVFSGGIVMPGEIRSWPLQNEGEETWLQSIEG